MTSYDVVDTVIIDADPATVFTALMDEVQGVTGWWAPHFRSRPREGTPVGRVGGVVDVRIRWIVRLWFSARMTQVEDNRRLVVEFFEGHFLGVGIWTFEPAGEGTRIHFRWTVRSNHWIYPTFCRIVDFGKIHSNVVQAGFEALARHVRQLRQGRAATGGAPRPRVAAALATVHQGA